MNRGKRANVFMVAVGLLAWAACGQTEHPASERAPSEPVKAEVATVLTRQVPVSEATPGTVQARTAATLSSQTSGRILKVLVEPGDRVRSGQTLVEIDSRSSALQLRQADAAIEEAEAALAEIQRATEGAAAGREAAVANAELAASTYRRFSALLEKKSVSRQEFEEAEARHKAAQAEVDRAEAALESLEARNRQALARREQARAAAGAAGVQLGFAAVTAPFAGRITAKHAQNGDLAMPGQPLLTLEDERGYRLEVAVRESRMGQVQTGQVVRVRIDALDAEMDGRIDEVEPRADPNTRSFVVKIALPATADLRSGMFGRAFFDSGGEAALTVPSSAVLRRGQLTGVYVVDSEKRARFRLVRTGRQTKDWTEILSGLREGESFILEPGPEVREGSPIV